MQINVVLEALVAAFVRIAAVPRTGHRTPDAYDPEDAWELPSWADSEEPSKRQPLVSPDGPLGDTRPL
jgi:hypothetical protein